ncbi:MAG TPA: hypothetical protein VIG24_10805, partial [Acidimicrobiia bacterium]
WKYRRSLVIATTGISFLMILVALFDPFDRQVSSQAIVGAVSLLSIVLSAYVGFATVDDRWQRMNDGSPYESSQDRGAYGDGLADDAADRPLR